MIARLSEATGVEIVSVDPLPDAAISLDLEDVTLERAIDAVLSGFNKVVVRGDAPPRIVSVVIAGRRPAPDEQGGRQAGRGALEGSRAPGLSRDPGQALGSATVTGRRELARRIVDELIRAGGRTELRDAVEELMEAIVEDRGLDVGIAAVALGRLVGEMESVEGLRDARVAAAALTDALIAALHEGDPATYFEVLEALRAPLGPDPAAGALAQIVGDRHASTRLRSLAAQGLGEIGDARAVPALGVAFEGLDPVLLQSAANGLARIGGDAALVFLLEAVAEAGSSRQEAAAVAMAFHGGGRARRSLAEIVEAGDVDPDSLPADVVQHLDRIGTSGGGE